MQSSVLTAPEAKVETIDPIIADLVPGYLEARRAELIELRECVRHCRLEKLSVLGHRLKGSGAGYGFPELTRLGAEIEDGATDQDLGRVAEAVRSLARYLESVRWVVRGG